MTGHELLLTQRLIEARQFIAEGCTCRQPSAEVLLERIAEALALVNHRPG